MAKTIEDDLPPSFHPVATRARKLHLLIPDALDRFDRLIVTINEKLARHIARNAGTFK